MAFNYNQATVLGRLTKDPDFKQLKDNFGILNFRVAVSRSHKKDDEVDFIPVVLKGKVAESGQKILKKGSPVLIWGRIQVRSYELKDEVKWMTEISADNFQILEKKDVEAVTSK